MWLKITLFVTEETVLEVKASELLENLEELTMISIVFTHDKQTRMEGVEG